MEKIKIKYHSDVQGIGKIKVGDWIDLRCADSVLINEGEFKMIPLGVSMELPAGYEAIVAPRSSTFKKYGIIMVNSIGIIDNSYCGDDDQWMFPALCLKGTDSMKVRNGNNVLIDAPFTFISKGDRIAQFRIQRIQPEIEFIEVDYLEGENRGGFGSTGIK